MNFRLLSNHAARNVLVVNLIFGSIGYMFYGDRLQRWMLGLPTGDKLLLVAASDGNLNQLEQAMEEGASLEVRDKSGQTALMAAALCGRTSVVRRLIELGADVSATMRFGTTALSLASMNGHEEIVEMLLAAGAHVEPLPGAPVSPLDLARQQGHRGVVAKLLAAAAHTDAKFYPDDTPLVAAVSKNQPAIAELLVRPNSKANDRTHTAGWR
jgi:ankyrin repeat protein